MKTRQSDRWWCNTSQHCSRGVGHLVLCQLSGGPIPWSSACHPVSQLVLVLTHYIPKTTKHDPGSISLIKPHPGSNALPFLMHTQRVWRWKMKMNRWRVFLRPKQSKATEKECVPSHVDILTICHPADYEMVLFWQYPMYLVSEFISQ